MVVTSVGRVTHLGFHSAYPKGFQSGDSLTTLPPVSEISMTEVSLFYSLFGRRILGIPFVPGTLLGSRVERGDQR